MALDGDVTRVALANRYRLDAPIGRGGMGVVWRGEDTLLRRPVAVKEVVVPASTATDVEAVRARVMREAQAAARLSHPRTVTVYDVVEQDDRVWLVMELVEAGSLADLVTSSGPLPPDQAAAVGLGLVEALTEAHRRGIVHRDVKPGNVLVLPDGSVKLTDFGIASVHDDPRITTTGMVIGSPSYMAPEQARGERTGPAVDVWGLGITLWYAVEGTGPFGRDSAVATLGAIVNEPLPVPTSAGALTPVLARLLDKDPARRPTLDEAGRLLAAVAGDRAATGAIATTAVAATAADGPVAAAPTALADAPVVAPATALADAPVAAPATALADAPVLAPRSVRRATAPPPRRSGGWGWAIAILLVIALVAAALIALNAARDDDGDGTSSATPPSSSATSTTAAPSTTATTAAPATTATTAAPTTTSTTAAPTTTATTSPPTTTAPPVDGLPAGWVTYTDPATGYVIGHPEGWTIEEVAPIRTRFRDPATGDYLMVEWTDEPGPSALGAWEEQSQSFASTHDGYQEIRLEQVEYRGYDAAVWEFTWEESGTTLHGHDLGMVTGDYGFALFSVADHDRWDEVFPTFQAMADVFAPPG